MKRMMLKDGKLREFTVFVLGINFGVRISDLLSLTWKDVYDNGEFREQISIREKKTGKYKRFALNANCKAALKQLRNEEAPQTEDTYLFLSKSNRSKNKPLTRQYVWDFLNKYSRLSGVTERIGTHTLRKTFGYHAYQKGVSLELLQAIFNHSSSKETLRYIGITQDEINEVYVNLNL